jgi:hypothetical protein
MRSGQKVEFGTRRALDRWTQDEGRLFRTGALAAVGHAAGLLLVAVAFRAAPTDKSPATTPRDAWVEVALTPDVPTVETQPTTDQASGSFGGIAEIARALRRTPSADRTGAMESTLSSEDATSDRAPDQEAPGAPPARRSLAELGLEGAITRDLLLSGRRDPGATNGSPPQAPKPDGDVGRLREGLRASDGMRGLGRSGPILSAARAAALGRGPARGNAWFDVSTDAEGRVSSVTLLRFGSDGPAWQRVGRELQSRLGDRRLRVPEGARGLRATIRIAVGPDAAPPNDFKLGRSGGLQPTGPLASSPAAMSARDPSPRAHIYGREPAPALEFCVECWSLSGGNGQAPRVRVELIDEVPL